MMNTRTEHSGSPSISIDICIVTYKRPSQLRNCLKSIVCQSIQSQFPIQILVCDNDVAQSALNTVQQIRISHPTIQIGYFVEPIPNIALARNRALSNSKAELIAFIDDDEIAAFDWLEKAYEAMKGYEADVVFGRMIPQYESDVPLIFRRGEAHVLPNPLTGSTEQFVPSTNNVVAKRKIYELKKAGSFDASFGLTGGSDTHFFSDPGLKQFRLIWCREAITFEKFDRRRANFKWYIKRHVRCGAIGARVAVSYKNGPSSRTLAVRTRLMQTRDTFFYMAKRCWKRRSSWSDFFRLIRTIAYNVGFLGNIVCGINLYEYKKPITE